MPRNKNISERLPHFYRYWDSNSSIYNLIVATGKRLDETEKELISIIKAHWIDTASRKDLDMLGELYNIKRKEYETDQEYRYRLKIAIINNKGGGTIGTIKMLVSIILRLPQDYPFQIVENPPIKFKRKWQVNAGREWIVNPRNIYDTEVDITIEAITKNVNIRDPTITNITTGESVTFRGNMAYGDILRISNGRARLNGEYQSNRLSTANILTLPRKRSKWRYTEYVGANIGVFDRSQFDRSVFAVETLSNVTFEWVAHQPAIFELHIPKEMLVKAGITEKYMQDIVNSVKTCGVRAEVKIINKS